MVACRGFSSFCVASGWERPLLAGYPHSGVTIEMLDTLVRWFHYWIFHSFWQYSDDREIELDNEIIDKEETDYRECGKNRRKHLQALVPSKPDNRSSGITVVQPSFVMDQPNKKQTWLYDTPGVINEKQVWWTVLFSSAMQDWALAVPWVAPGNLPYFCVLMTTVRNLSFFIKKSHTGHAGFHGLASIFFWEQSLETYWSVEF